MANLKLSVNEAKFMILKALGFQAEYRADADLVTSNHKVEFTDGRSELEESAGQS